jgi:hypothetical protein
VINDLRDAIFAIALPTPPAPITSALMVGLSGSFQTHFGFRGRLSIPLTFAKHASPFLRIECVKSP